MDCQLILLMITLETIKKCPIQIGYNYLKKERKRNWIDLYSSYPYCPTHINHVK